MTSKPPFKNFQLITVLLAAVLVSASVSAKVLIPAPPQVAGTAWILMDATTGEVLMEHNADQQVPPASLTKMMTSYVVSTELHNGKIAGTRQRIDQR